MGGRRIFRGLRRKRRRSREPVQRKRQSWGKSEAPHHDPLQGSTHYRLCCERQENARLEEERQRQEVPCKTAVFTLVVGMRLPSHSASYCYVEMQAAAELRRQEEHRKVSKSNSMLQSTRSPSVWHVRRVLGSASMLAVVIVCGRSKPRHRRRRAFAAEVICLSESGMISVRRRGRD